MVETGFQLVDVLRLLQPAVGPPDVTFLGVPVAPGEHHDAGPGAARIGTDLLQQVIAMAVGQVEVQQNHVGHPRQCLAGGGKVGGLDDLQAPLRADETGELPHVCIIFDDENDRHGGPGGPRRPFVISEEGL